MDPYTQETKNWLDQRFRAVDESGIYVAHQPIYGLNGFHCEPAPVEKYIRTYQVVRALERLEFDSFLDAGGAEGYRAHLVKTLFAVESRNCDLSEEACKRSRDIFGIGSDVADLHSLPYRDDSFDVVLCSESIEHVQDFEAAVAELLRVARKTVIITVPHESQEIVADNLERHLPHAHIHSFDLSSFDFLGQRGYEVRTRKMVSPYLRLPSSLLPVQTRAIGTRYPKIIYRLYNSTVPWLRRLLTESAAATLIRLDEKISRISSRYEAALFVIHKVPSNAAMRMKRISAKEIVGFRVPYHRIGQAR